MFFFFTKLKNQTSVDIFYKLQSRGGHIFFLEFSFFQERWIFFSKVLHPHNKSQGPFFRFLVGTLILLKASIDTIKHITEILFDFNSGSV